MRRKMAAGLVGVLMGLSVPGVALAQDGDPGFPHPGVGLCVPLPDPPLVLDWTIRAIKVALIGEVDCGL